MDANDDVVVAGMADEVHQPAADLFVAKLAGPSGAKLWDHWWTAEESDQAQPTGIAVTLDQDIVVIGESVTVAAPKIST